jgi:hypothetical protein
MNIDSIDRYLSPFAITSVETGQALKAVDEAIRQLWVSAQFAIANSTPSTLYSEVLNPLFLNQSAELFKYPIDEDCRIRAIGAYESARACAIANDLKAVMMDLLTCRHWLHLGISIGCYSQLELKE